jgi:hypothetical protein
MFSELKTQRTAIKMATTLPFSDCALNKTRFRFVFCLKPVIYIREKWICVTFIV